jgi:hypothetical protein
MAGISGVNIDVGSVLSSAGDLAKAIREAITGKSIIDPNKQAELLTQAQTIESDTIKGQQAIELELVKSEKWWKAGARPFIMWVCGAAFAYTYVFQPFIVLVLDAFSVAIVPPKIDMTELMPILIGILGLGAYRSYDKKQESTNGK